MDEYFDLTNTSSDIDTLSIAEESYFECVLIDINTKKTYKGFVLAKSPQGNVLTICDTSFQRSKTDDKFQPRLVFRKADPDLQDTHLRSGVNHVRIPFKTGQEGYRQFWKMVFFLYRFKETIDFGDFDGSYHVLSQEQITNYLSDSDNMEKVRKAAESLNVEIAAALRPAATIKILKEYRDKLSEFIETSSSETTVQNWLDENHHMYRRQRCMIFGLEFIDFKREGSSSSKKIDILTRIGSKNLERVLIELKGPSSDIFSVTTTGTINNETNEYRLHPDVSRAIPQILEYRKDLNEKNPGDPELESLGITIGKANIQKCIIIIGKNKPDSRWQKNRVNLAGSLSSSLEIWTYSDLLHKLDATIENLESDITPESDTVSK